MQQAFQQSSCTNCHVPYVVEVHGMCLTGKLCTEHMFAVLLQYLPNSL